MHASLLRYESHLQQLNALTNLTITTPSANITYNKQSPTHTIDAQQSALLGPPPSLSQSSIGCGYPSNLNRGGGGGQSRGRGGGCYGSQYKPTCQICGKYGNSATVCHYRSNMNVMGSSTPRPPPPSHPTAYLASPEIVADHARYARCHLSCYL